MADPAVADSTRLVPVPKTKQNYGFDCGPAALKSICLYFGVGPEDEDDYIRACDTGTEKGTTPEDLAKAACSFGLQAEIYRNLSGEELLGFLQERKPVICAIQAWGDEEDYDELEDGHYVVAIGFDDNGIHFEDPSLEDTKGYIAFDEFMERWHDKEYDQTYQPRLGIVIWSDTEEPTADYEPKTKPIE